MTQRDTQRQTDRPNERQRETGRQTETQTHTERQTDKQGLRYDRARPNLVYERETSHASHWRYKREHPVYLIYFRKRDPENFK